ncbi:MAG TPA: VCBS repeat-containing protein, partial [Thermoanaerobaculia bacterium]
MKLRHTTVLLALAVSVAPLSGAPCEFGFLSPTSSVANAKAGDVTTGDFNNDGFIDVVVVNRTLAQISILLGTAGGGLGAPTAIGTPGENSQDDILAGDFNNDNKLDLLLTISTNTVPNFPYLKLLLGNGNGTFGAVPYTGQQLVNPPPSRLVLGDFNEDGLMDAATTSGSGFSSMQNIGGKLAQKAQYLTPSGVT